MTITYTLEVSKAKFWGFPKLLARWKGSIYRLVYREIAVYLAIYYFLTFFYRFCLDEDGKRMFEKLAMYCRECLSVVMITFLLGFYVQLVMGRWWEQYMNIPWPDKIAMEISTFVVGDDPRTRLIRRAMVRYLNLLAVFTFQNTSTVIKKRFPTSDHLVEAGLMTPEEKIELENTKSTHGLWWIPAHWFSQLAMKARSEGCITDDLHLKTLIDEVMIYRGQCGMIWSYDWISVPLVYTQVVTIAVYSFFAASLFGRQYLLQEGLDSSNNLDYYCPVFTIFQFFFFVGWLKVAESMICPFGEDDDDFDLNWIIDRNIQVAYLIVDQLHGRYPTLTKDYFWNNADADIPYTNGTTQFKQEPYIGSTTAMSIPDHAAQWDENENILPVISEEDGTGQFLRKRTHTNRTKDEEDDVSVGSVANSDVSRDSYEKRRSRALGGLMLGFSRQTLTSKFGSKFGSLASVAGFGKNAGTRPSSPPNYGRQVSTDRILESLNGLVPRHTDSVCAEGETQPRDQEVNHTDADANSTAKHEANVTPLPPLMEFVPDPDDQTVVDDELTPHKRLRKQSWARHSSHVESTIDEQPIVEECGSTTPLVEKTE